MIHDEDEASQYPLYPPKKPWLSSGLDASMAKTNALRKRGDCSPEPVRVLQITQALGGGVQKYVIQLCQHLDRSRFEVTGCCSSESLAFGEVGDIPFPTALENAGVPYFLVPMERAVRPVNDLLALIRIYRRIKKDGFDIVHAHSSKAGVLARIAARLANVPVVLYSPHAFSFAAPNLAISTLAFVFFEKIAAHFCDAIIADSQGERELALKRCICQRDKIRVISPGISAIESERTLRDHEKADFLRELRIPADHKIVSFVGRLAPQKDPITFIRCAHHLISKYRQVSFLLVGEGPLREKCADEVQRGGLHDRIKMLGWRRDYQMLLGLSDVVAISSVYEGLPFILLEAMAQGKPVVATNVAGNREVIVSGQNGFLLPPQSPAPLAEACLQLLQDPELANRMGQAARGTVIKEFNLAQTISLTEKIYTTLLETKREAS